MAAEEPSCTCTPGDGCDGDGYDDGDDRQCVYCASLDGEWPCPADPCAYDPDIEALMDLVCKSDDSAEAMYEPVVVCADGSEPFASADLGNGLVLDLTAKVRRVDD